jgi:hypothetical protein
LDFILDLIPAGSENDVFKYRSINNIVVGPAITDNDNRSSGAVIATAHINNWIHSSFIFMCLMLIFIDIKYIAPQLTSLQPTYNINFNIIFPSMPRFP